jgi:hypothetical protein
MKEDLLGRSTVSRRKAAVKLRDITIDNCCELLIQALEIEEKKNNFLTKVELIKTLGIKRCIKAGDYIETHFVDKLEDFNLLKMVAATALIRIKRLNINEVDIVIDLINKEEYSLTEGALESLGYDQIVPSIEQQKIILKKCASFGIDRPKGYTDPRYGLAAACANWDVKLVKDFLNNCLLSNDVPLVYVAKNALERKYVKLR